MSKNDLEGECDTFEGGSHEVLSAVIRAQSNPRPTNARLPGGAALAPQMRDEDEGIVRQRLGFRVQCPESLIEVLIAQCLRGPRQGRPCGGDGSSQDPQFRLRVRVELQRHAVIVDGAIAAGHDGTRGSNILHGGSGLRETAAYDAHVVASTDHHRYAGFKAKGPRRFRKE